ncbi:hypothetical protein DMB95_09285 [Campylobacter sp. MIT 12-8780]|uniref:hypothetical protein n=1 Tax=unclassified Campylobacter TaxID=2593542 RepID=UPI0010F45978|nr:MULTISPECIES: hypothetical protein [unclassified Campylobacter]NDJ28060.1 hypothetical protein [Campylobacter sp. MIT 19-121]TKX28284.1 hypothetical protein CQA38_08545 [Campylobacter sp. MIT 12-5580]TQR39974.1 hypothetical protein DMB95_09285 [Campylobacter sp. MIT 12-8780]
MSEEYDIAAGIEGYLDEAENLSENTLDDTHLYNDIIGQELEKQDNEIIQEVIVATQVSPKQENKAQIFEPLDPDKPVNLKTLLNEQGELLKNLDEKATRLENIQLDEETKGLLIDFQKLLVALDEKTLKIMEYFGENISDQDRALINRTLLLKQNLSELYDLIKFFESKEYIKKTQEFEKKFRNLIRSSKERIDNFENNLRKALDSSLPVYNEILKLFIQRQNELLDNLYIDQKDKAQIFSKELSKEIDLSKDGFKELAYNFELTSKKLKHFAFALLFCFGVFGILFGVLSALTYLKYQEYQEIENKMRSLSQRINGIAVKKDEANNLILSLPKSNASIDNDKDRLHITIKE